VRIAFLSSTPANALEGSGTFTAIDGLRAGLRRLGHEPVLRPLRWRTGFHTFDRWLYNAAVAVAPPAAEVVAGVDLDGFLWARRRRQPFVVCLKGVIADELQNERGVVRALLAVQARWERANVHRADRVIVPSRYSATVAAEAYGLPRERIAVVPEPIDLDEWRRRLHAAERPAVARPRVLAVARMYPRKRLEDLLEAAALLRGRIPAVEIRIVGEGPESARLRARHAALGLGGTVTFLGEVSTEMLAVEYVSAECFCLPTVQEGFGLVFAEAMAAGLPVVSCRAAAVPEIVEDRRTGFLVNPRSPDELAMALETLLTNPGLRGDFGAEARRRVEAFDAVRVARRFVEALPA
jgi:glycosyltransferase involved in cell wall biosynthesis